MEAMTKLNRWAEEHTLSLRFTLTFKMGEDVKWIPPKLGWWKMNCDVAFANGKAAITDVIRDESELIKALAQTVLASSAYKAKTKAVEWAVIEAAREDWTRFQFSSDALQVVEDINSARESGGWFTREVVLNIRRHLMDNGWKLE